MDPNSPEWKSLLEKSHNTSLYVTPDWLEQEKLIVGGLFANGELTTGIVAQEGLSVNGAPYQGVLTTNRSNFASVSKLVEWLEGFGGFPMVWNAPSLIDVRPFQTRKDSRWLTHINYTFYSYPPNGSMEGVEELQEVEKKVDVLDSMGAPGWMSLVEDIKLWTLPNVDGMVLWGVDPQDRGYYLYGYGHVIPIMDVLTRMHQSADLSGTEGWKKRYYTKLRTIYGMIRTQ